MQIQKKGEIRERELFTYRVFLTFNQENALMRTSGNGVNPWTSGSQPLGRLPLPGDNVITGHKNFL